MRPALAPLSSGRLQSADVWSPRGQSQPRSNMDRVLRPAGRHRLVPLGRGRARRCWGGRRGASQVHQPDRCIHQDGNPAPIPPPSGSPACLTACVQIESLPTRANDEQPLQNILSISTAGRNRYLLHFNSHHSLIQWTSGIRLAMFEHSTLQEAYTGALIAGKGKVLNNINIIMERAKQPVAEWVRVRFGAGVPWRRCWCVIEPPNEKEYQKAQKDWKKRNPYDRSHGPMLKGQVRFYDSKKDAEKKKKHLKPIATITDAFSSYAIYPQAKALIDGSTLLKVEGQISIHSDPPSSTEGFVFIMPEVPPAVSGFELLLRFLFPTWDTFCLYGRPGRLVASVLDPRSLMFAMPKHKRYGYLEILDVSGLILTDGSSSWSEQEWRKRMKELTGQRMAAVEEGGNGSHSRSASRSSKRLSFGAQPARPRVGFADDSASVRSGRSATFSQPGQRTDSAPPDPNRERAPSAMGGHRRHSRNISDTQIGNALASHGLQGPGEMPLVARGPERAKTFATDLAATPERVSSEDDRPPPPPANTNGTQQLETPEPVSRPPAFAHSANSRPQQKPYHSPDMRRATARLSNTTLSQIAIAGGVNPDAFRNDIDASSRGPNEYGAGSANTENIDPRGPAVHSQANENPEEMNANTSGSREALTLSPGPANSTRPSPGLPLPDRGFDQNRSHSPLVGPPPGPPHPSFPPNNWGRPPHGPEPQPNSSRGPPPEGWRPPQPGMNPNQHTGPQHPSHFQGPPGGYSQAPYQRGPPPSARRTPPPGQGRRPPPPQQGSPPVNRKPLPQRTTSLQRRPENAGIVSPMAMAFNDSVPSIPEDGTRPHAMPPPSSHRQTSGKGAADSHFNDASSTDSPDYASTRKSSETQDSVERPRAGVLKTIGDGSSSSGTGFVNSPKSEFDIPEVNFGPTLNYGAATIPRDKAPGPHSSRPFSPTAGRKSPGPGPGLSHHRQESDDTLRRAVPWQPGAASGAPSNDHTVSPEQFVQQRVAAAAAPLYSHQRNPSANTLNELRSGTPTSPNKRPGSHGRTHSRHNSADLLQSGRPASQGTMAALSGGEVSSHLSAREQEHVARITGSPLIAMAGNKGPGPSKGSLLDTLQAREREKMQMRQGYGGNTVAQAIDQRQREQSQQAQRAAQMAYAQHQAQFAPQPGAMMGNSPPPMMHGPGMGPRSMSPGPGMMGPGMGPARSGPGFQPNHGWASATSTSDGSSAGSIQQQCALQSWVPTRRRRLEQEPPTTTAGACAWLPSAAARAVLATRRTWETNDAGGWSTWHIRWPAGNARSDVSRPRSSLLGDRQGQGFDEEI